MNATAGPELTVLAATLDDRAGRIETLGDLLAARAAAATWQGPAAERFRATTADRQRELRDAAASMRVAAHQARLLATAAP